MDGEQIGKGAGVDMSANETDKDSVVNFIQCPICDTWSLGSLVHELGGVKVEGFFVWRLDLGAPVCRRCDINLGPDLARVNSAKLSKNMSSWLDEYLQQFSVDRPDWMLYQN